MTPMHRRTFLLSTVGALAVARARAQGQEWRTFEITTRVEIEGPQAPTRAWLPLAHPPAERYQRVIKQTWRGSAARLHAVRDETTGAGILFADWPAPEGPREIELTLQIATRDRTTNWRDRTMRGAPAESLRRYLQSTRLLQLDGIVRDRALRITRGEIDEMGKARAIYEWIVENAERDPKVRGCGVGDIRAMLINQNLRGKCADLNGLFVGLARSVGVPARDVYGIRVAPSRMFKSLGASGDVTASQHCRAEFHSPRHGWVPVDPADVRKVALEEKPGLTRASSEVQYASRQLFGSWEGNWIAFNDAHDLVLPSSAGGPLPFFMYPQAEVAGVRRDSLDPATFRYQITAREIS
jgi:transglutaminase-like putative cysteine protease